MKELILSYYSWLSSFSASLSYGLGGLADSLNIPVLSALIFGMIGASAPCQISSSVVTLAYLSREASSPQRVWGKALAFLLGKLTIYTLIGGLVVLLGLQLDQIRETAIPVVVVARRLMGPLLILVGLFMLGLLKFHLALGDRISDWIQAMARDRQGMVQAYLLGIAFSFTFCPTLFWLFFGLTIPLAITSPGGVIIPSIFAIGTTLPVLALAGLFAFGVIDIRQFVRRFKPLEMWIQKITASIFILIGIQETLLYWFL